jgi:hypothetical protein
MLKLKFTAASVAIAMAAVVGANNRAEATLYTFNDPGWVSGSVDTGTGIVLLNALRTPSDVADTISGIVMTFTTVPSSPLLTSQTNPTGNMVTFATGVNPNPPPPNSAIGTAAPGAMNGNWTLSASLAVLTLSANHSCVVGGGAPCDLIVGPLPANDGNGSLISHNPFVDQQGRFVISGITDLLISSLVVQFGTGPTNRLQTLDCPICAPNPNANAVPLPAALPLFVSGLGALGWFGWRRKKKAEALTA